MAEENNIYWEEIETPDPSEFAVGIFVKDTFIRGRMSVLKVGTKLRNGPDWFPRMPTSTQEYGEYQFMKRGRGPEGYVIYYFGKPKTDVENRKPFRSVSRQGDHPWPMIIDEVDVVKDSKAVVSGNAVDGAYAGIAVSPKLRLRIKGTPAIEQGSLIIKREFLSPTKFRIPKLPVPIPEMMHIEYNDLRENIPASLHGDVRLRSFSSVVATVVNETAGAGGGVQEGFFFPKTNMTRWRPIIYPDEQQQLENGLWHRIQTIVIPPSRKKSRVLS